MKDPRDAAPASFINLAYDSGRIVEKARITALIGRKLADATVGEVDAQSVLVALLKEVSEGKRVLEDEE